MVKTEGRSSRGLNSERKTKKTKLRKPQEVKVGRGKQEDKSTETGEERP